MWGAGNLELVGKANPTLLKEGLHSNDDFVRETQFFFSPVGITGAEEDLGADAPPMKGTELSWPRAVWQSSQSLSPENKHALRFLFTGIYHSDIYNRKKLETT